MKRLATPVMTECVCSDARARVWRVLPVPLIILDPTSTRTHQPPKTKTSSNMGRPLLLT